ncbi:MAG: hypothetical protein H5U11_12335 [Rhizobium sp.]|nr:hypothetical protein [Rhizobium sp.]
MSVKIGLQNVAKIARNSDFFGAIDERKNAAVQAGETDIAGFTPLLVRVSPAARNEPPTHL